MKRKFLVLGVVLSCLLGLSGCGSESQTNSIDNYRYPSELFNDQTIQSYVSYIEDANFEEMYLGGITPENFDEKNYIALAMSSSNSGSGIAEADDEYFNAMKAGYTSWYNAIEELGFGSIETLSQDIRFDPEEVHYSINDKGVLVIDVTLHGTKRTALMQLYVDNDLELIDAGVTVDKTLSEKLTNAGLNTLLGMGMAFAILILISLIICLFPVLFGEKKKKVSDKDIASKAMENTINQIVEQEDLSGDSELVAVIAAAIAAYEGSGSTDGFRVRSIRRVNNNWKKF